MIASPNLCDKSWVTEQYDRYVLGNTVLAQPEDAGVLRIDEATGLGVALVGRRQRPVRPARPVHRARSWRWPRPTATSPSPAPTPVAVTNCLNFGSPEDPGVMWQFAEAVRGLADGCQELGIPVTGGNVSFYNQTGGAADPPDARSSACSACCDERGAAGADGLRHRRATGSSCSARPGRSSPARSGPT